MIILVILSMWVAISIPAALLVGLALYRAELRSRPPGT